MQISNRNRRTVQIFRWVARVWSTGVCIFAFVLLVSSVMQSGDDPFSLIYWLLLGLWCLSALGLAAAWRWELIGVIIALTALISREMVYLIVSGQVLVDFGMVWLPILFPAALFILVRVIEKRNEAAQRPRDIYD